MVAEDSAAFTVGRVRIVWPKEPVDGQLNLTFITEDNLYRQSNQAVSNTALGDANRKPLWKIEGLMDPWDVQWELTPADGTIGTLTGDTTLNPQHVPPASVSGPGPKPGTLTLKAMYAGQPTGFSDSVPIEVFADHLARDTQNFAAGRNCRKDPPPDSLHTGLELDDTGDPGSCVEDASLVCGPSAGHAAFGDKTERSRVTTTYTKVEMPWSEFAQATTTVSRGDVINLRQDNGTGPPGPVHWCTVLESGSARAAQTYAGDVLSREFRYERVEDYYYFYWDHWGFGGSFNDWLSDNAVIVIYRKPE